jgi:hypothetical protein
MTGHEDVSISSHDVLPKLHNVVALAAAACGDIPIGPVDHSCPVENSCEHK